MAYIVLLTWTVLWKCELYHIIAIETRRISTQVMSLQTISMCLGHKEGLKKLFNFYDTWFLTCMGKTDFKFLESTSNNFKLYLEKRKIYNTVEYFQYITTDINKEKGFRITNVCHFESLQTYLATTDIG